MTKTSIEIDDSKLDAAKGILRTRGKRDTVDAALDEVIARSRREGLVERLESMEGMDLADPDLMDAAWR